MNNATIRPVDCYNLYNSGNMRINDVFIEQIRKGTEEFLELHQELSSEKEKSLRQVPHLLQILDQLYLNTHLPLRVGQRVALAVKYINSDYDFLPARISGPVGSLDDIMVTALVLKETAAKIEIDNYCTKCEKLEEHCKTLIDISRQFLPPEIYRKIVRDFSLS